jgi:polyribonucleotide nucleotidyltransferase
VNAVADYLTEGQEVRVKVLDVDNRGRIKLSIKEALEPVAGASVEVSEETAPQG